MQAEEISYCDFLERRFPAPRVVRTFGPWKVLSSTDSGRFWLLLVNHATEEVVVCEYLTLFERQHDIEKLRRIGAEDETVRTAVVEGFRPKPPSPPAPPPPGAPGVNVLPRPGWEDV